MAFALTRHESIGAGMKRIVCRELEQTLARLRGNEDPVETVHEARKSLKRVRSCLRLLRAAIGDEVYRRDNVFFRDCARPLSKVRDATALVEAMSLLASKHPSLLEDARWLAARERLARRVIDDNGALAALLRSLEAALPRVDGWRIDADGWDALSGGLYRTYRAGRRALAAVIERPSVETLHELRKKTKYFWHALQLLESSAGDEFHCLSQLLGDDHDLALLRRVFVDDPPILAVIDHTRSMLEEQALILARRLYAPSPRELEAQLAAHFAAWRTLR